MRDRGLFIAGVVALGLGVTGLAVGWLLGWFFGAPAADLGRYSSAGERIYYTGVGEDGLPIPRTGSFGMGMMSGTACVDCHGEDGRGGRVTMMMGSFESPDIRYETLTSPHTERGETEPGWSDADIARAIRDGVEPSGDRLRAPMPRWDMTDSEIDEIIAYLKEL